VEFIEASRSTSYKAKIHGDTSALIVRGQVVQGILRNLIRGVIGSFGLGEVTREVARNSPTTRKIFYHFPGGAAIGIRSPKPCKNVETTKISQILALDGYYDLSFCTRTGI
jgi:uncharacterized membrane protein YeaQ/YmgE (transglycosylase-associated protein family)